MPGGTSGGRQEYRRQSINCDLMICPSMQHSSFFCHSVSSVKFFDTTKETPVFLLLNVWHHAKSFSFWSIVQLTHCQSKRVVSLYIGGPKMGLKGSVGYIWFIEELFIQKMMRVLNITVHFSYFFREGEEREKRLLRKGFMIFFTL